MFNHINFNHEIFIDFLALRNHKNKQHTVLIVNLIVTKSLKFKNEQPSCTERALVGESLEITGDLAIWLIWAIILGQVFFVCEVN